MSKKVILIGDSGVGKTSILNRSVYNKFEPEQLTTLGASFKSKEVFFSLEGEQKSIKLQIWDTAGQEKFQSLTKMYFRDAKAALIVYDITDKESF